MCPNCTSGRWSACVEILKATEPPPVIALQGSTCCYPPASRHSRDGSHHLRSLTWFECVPWISESQTLHSPPAWWVLPALWPYCNILHDITLSLEQSLPCQCKWIYAQILLKIDDVCLCRHKVVNLILYIITTATPWRTAHMHVWDVFTNSRKIMFNLRSLSM